MAFSRKLISDTFIVAGVVCLIGGTALIYVPAALILAGLGSVAWGLFGIQVGEKA